MVGEPSCSLSPLPGRVMISFSFSRRDLTTFCSLTRIQICVANHSRQLKYLQRQLSFIRGFWPCQRITMNGQSTHRMYNEAPIRDSKNRSEERRVGKERGEQWRRVIQ